MYGGIWEKHVLKKVGPNEIELNGNWVSSSRGLEV